MRIALFQPDIPQNAGSILRTAACLGVAVDIIEPCGFLLGDRQFRRAGMDYLAQVEMARHASWQDFRRQRAENRSGRLILLTTRSDTAYTAFRFLLPDTLVVGRETCGVPDAVHAEVDARVKVPMLPGRRSFNVAVATAIVLAEALRQTGGMPAATP
jgi:tRNA (cytidine/uridine-2'-O-)-methyltransferase